MFLREKPTEQNTQDKKITMFKQFVLVKAASIERNSAVLS